MYDTKTIARFWAKVDIRGPDECWPWIARRSHGGYGNFRVGRIGTKQIHKHANAVAYEITSGPLNGLYACHTCDNPPCCNPHHIFAGTAMNNAKDMIAKGRGNLRRPPVRGEDNGNAKLTDKDVTLIRALIADGMTNKKIGKMFGVVHSTVSRIRRGRAWVNKGCGQGPR